MSVAKEQFLTPPEISKRFGVATEKVLYWIRSGKLRAVNLGNGSIRPRWRIDPDDLARFLEKRSNESIR